MSQIKVDRAVEPSLRYPLSMRLFSGDWSLAAREVNYDAWFNLLAMK
jgi:hypothetical protein